jgi:hypothetical protein
MSMQQTTRDYFDHPDDSKATTWDHVLKSEKVKEMTFNQLDKNRRFRTSATVCNVSVALGLFASSHSFSQHLATCYYCFNCRPFVG